jgi:hypothetical protein
MINEKTFKFLLNSLHFYPVQNPESFCPMRPSAWFLSAAMTGEGRRGAADVAPWGIAAMASAVLRIPIDLVDCA